MMAVEWFIVDAPHLYAAAEVGTDGLISRTAPILRWLSGKPVGAIRVWCHRKRYLLTLYHTDGSIEFAP